jgi:uncharacterized protein (DUF3084 family)
METNKMSAKTNLARIKKTYRLIDDNFDAVYTKSTDKQRKELITARDAARDTFWRAAASDLSDNNSLVKSISKDLETTNKQIEQELKNLQNVVGILKVITQAVKLAASLAVLAAAA